MKSENKLIREEPLVKSEEDTIESIKLLELAKYTSQLYPEAVNEIIEFLSLDGAIEAIKESDIRNISLMREGFYFNNKDFFISAKTMNSALAAILTIAKSNVLSTDKIISELQSVLQIYDDLASKLP